MIHHRAARLLGAAALVVTAACSGAQSAAPEPSASPRATAGRTPSTSSAQVVVEESDAGIEAVRAVASAIADGDTAAAWALLGPRTRAAVGSPDDLGDLGGALARLVADDAPFDDVIVAETPAEQTNLVVLGDADTAHPVVGSVTTTGGDAVVELSPPAPSDVEFTVTDRRRIEIATPAATDVELVVDGFHFHPSGGDDGAPAVMTIPYPMSDRAHILGAWYRTDDGTSGVGSAIVEPGDG